MTYQVYLSRIVSAQAHSDDVLKFIARLKAFAFEKGKPRPTASPEVEFSIVRSQTKGKPDTYTPDYVIIDDVTPPPEANEVN